MAASTNLSAATVEVAPGATASLTLRVRNTATVVDQMTFEVIGDAKEWTRIEPSTLSLFPNDEGTVEVVFAPPKLSSVPAGPMPFGIKVQPNEDPEGSAVEEGTLHIGVFYDVSAELVPRTSRGRRSATHDLAIDNRSNVAYRAQVSGSDKDLLLGFTPTPALVDIAAGTAGFAKVRVRPRRRFWRGPSKTLAFQVTLEPNAGLAGLGLEQSTPGSAADSSASSPAGEKGSPGSESTAGASPAAITPPPPPPPSEPTTQLTPEVPVPAPSVLLDGTFVQEALLPKWLLKVLALILILALIAAALWWALVKPQIKAATKNQVSRQLAAAGITTTTSTTLAKGATAPSVAPGAGSSPTTAAAGSPSAGGGSPTQTGTTVAPSSSALSGAPVSGRLDASGNGTLSYTVPPGKTFQLTDIVFENPSGDTGLIVLARNGTVLLQTNMANFRDLDYHLVAPVIFTSTQQMQMTVTGCTDVCQPGVFYSGYLK
jgi:hypothetical protein